jgi:hypothetical protein
VIAPMMPIRPTTMVTSTMVKPLGRGELATGNMLWLSNGSATVMTSP